MSDYWDYNVPDNGFKKRVEELSIMVNKLECEKNNIIEIGIWKGTSAITFSKFFKKVYSLDIVKSSVKNLISKKIENIEALIRNEETIKLFKDDTIDVLYIDGNHTKDGVMTDLKEFYPKIKKGGYICGHDYGGIEIGVTNAVLEFFGRVPDILVTSNTCNGCSNFIYKKN